MSEKTPPPRITIGVDEDTPLKELQDKEEDIKAKLLSATLDDLKCHVRLTKLIAKHNALVEAVRPVLESWNSEGFATDLKTGLALDALAALAGEELNEKNHQDRRKVQLPRAKRAASMHRKELER